MREPTITDRLSDWFFGMTRLTCPLCTTTVMFRAVDKAEEARLRSYLADHIGSHKAGPDTRLTA